jgi:hypothetical protein
VSPVPPVEPAEQIRNCNRHFFTEASRGSCYFGLTMLSSQLQSISTRSPAHEPASWVDFGQWNIKSLFPLRCFLVSVLSILPLRKLQFSRYYLHWLHEVSCSLSRLLVCKYSNFICYSQLQTIFVRESAKLVTLSKGTEKFGHCAITNPGVHKFRAPGCRGDYILYERA